MRAVAADHIAAAAAVNALCQADHRVKRLRAMARSDVVMQCILAICGSAHLSAAVQAGGSGRRARRAAGESAGGLEHSHELVQHQPVQGGASGGACRDPSRAAAGGRESCCLHISWQSAVLDALQEHAEPR